MLEDGSYTIPVELDEEKARSILEDQAEDYDHDIRGSTQPYFSIDTGSERYDLIYLPSKEGLQAVARYDTEETETLEFHEIDELLGGETGC